MAKRLTVLGIVALFAVLPASANTFFQFAPNPGTPTPLYIKDTLADGMVSGYTTISLTGAPILWDLPNTLGADIRTGLLTFSVSTTNFAVGDIPNNTLVETGFSGTGSIIDTATGYLVLSWTFNFDDSTTLTVANKGHAGSFVDSTPIHVVSAPYLVSPDYANLLFQLSFLDSHYTWGSDGLPIIADPPIVGVCTNCRIASNDVDLLAPEPATMALFGAALIGLGLLGRKRFVR